MNILLAVDGSENCYEAVHTWLGQTSLPCFTYWTTRGQPIQDAAKSRDFVPPTHSHYEKVPEATARCCASLPPDICVYVNALRQAKPFCAGPQILSDVLSHDR